MINTHINEMITYYIADNTMERCHCDCICMSSISYRSVNAMTRVMHVRRIT